MEKHFKMDEKYLLCTVEEKKIRIRRLEGSKHYLNKINILN